ncbi:MAG: helix-turn-helix domain-containing protein [Bacteroidota bacterium]
MASATLHAACPVTAAVALVGGKWKIPLLWHLQAGPRRYGALRRAIPGISEKMLGQQLRALAADGLVERTVYAEVPPRVDYALTAQGRALTPALSALADWGVAHLDGPWCSEAQSTEGTA